MVNKRMKTQAVLTLIRKAARRKNLTVDPVLGRGKGSHQVYVIRNKNGVEVGRFNLTDTSKDVSWLVLRNTEDGLAHLFGDKWMGKR